MASDFDYYNNVYNYWSQNRTDERDALVSLSVRNGWFYGGYRMCSSNFPEPNNPSLAVDLLCHELGHTLGSPHTHNCSWPGGPIDYCEVLENCSSNYREYTNGSLMSYCRSVLSFHPLCRNLMRDYSEGKVSNSFKLNSLNKRPVLSNLFLLTDPNAQLKSNNPTFEWYAPVNTENFHFQISKTSGFADLVEDTLVNQSYFRSIGLGEGKYYARINTGNGTGRTEWSSVLPFSVPAFSENSSSPLLLETFLYNDATIAGHFRKYSGTDIYQVEIINEYYDDQTSLTEINMTASPMQSFSLPVNMSKGGRFRVRIRVGKDQKWSRWSDSRTLIPSWNSEVWKFTNLSKVSGTPVVALSLFKPGIVNAGLKQSIEIAKDYSFTNIAFKDSVLTNQINEWSSNKVLFYPKLEENQSYFVRTRVNYDRGLYSKWNAYSLATGQTDQRFAFLGSVSKNLLSTNMTFGEYQSVRFYNTGARLYVQSLYGGHYVTTDLKTWQPFTTSSTQGRLPNNSNLLAATNDGETYLFDENRALVKSSVGGATEFYYSSATNFYIPNLTPGWILKNDGVMFRTDNLGIAHFKDGNWKFYREEHFQSPRSIYLAADSDDQVWNVMEGGRVWTYKKSVWSEGPFFANWTSLKGISFDKNNKCYLYGDFGVATLNESRNWEIIPALADVPIRKVVFDDKDQMWMASYRHNGEGFIAYALIKLKDQKASVYSDGLNFLKEPFDVEVFDNKLLILTSGGEIHTFDETKIQRFEAAASYCAGEQVSVILSSNSTFEKQNQISLQLKNVDGGGVTKLIDVVTAGNKITGTLPAGLTSGSYRIQTVTTRPEISSNESDVFKVYANPSATIAIAENNRFDIKLKASGSEGVTYQWRNNGTAIPGETSVSLNVNLSGNYTVMVTNEGGCSSESNALKVDIDQPGEITLLQNAPNPALSSTEIAFYLPATQPISLELFNQKGQKVKQLAEGVSAAGWHVYAVSGNDISAGVYVYRLTAGKVTRSLKLVKL